MVAASLSVYNIVSMNCARVPIESTKFYMPSKPTLDVQLKHACSNNSNLVVLFYM